MCFQYVVLGGQHKFTSLHKRCIKWLIIAPNASQTHGIVSNFKCMQCFLPRETIFTAIMGTGNIFHRLLGHPFWRLHPHKWDNMQQLELRLPWSTQATIFISHKISHPDILVKPRTKETGCYNARIIMKFGSGLGSNVPEMPATFQKDWKTVNIDLVCSRPRFYGKASFLSDIENGPRILFQHIFHVI